VLNETRIRTENDEIRDDEILSLDEKKRIRFEEVARTDDSASTI